MTSTVEAVLLIFVLGLKLVLGTCDYEKLVEPRCFVVEHRVKRERKEVYGVGDGVGRAGTPAERDGFIIASLSFNSISLISCCAYLFPDIC